jgi:predicted RNase H-like HicB family nuclease
MEYTAIFEQEPDGGYVVTVPKLPGCLSQGDTREEAMANIREAIAVYLEHFQVRGIRPPKVDIEHISIDVQELNP